MEIAYFACWDRAFEGIKYLSRIIFIEGDVVLAIDIVFEGFRISRSADEPFFDGISRENPEGLERKHIEDGGSTDGI